MLSMMPIVAVYGIYIKKFINFMIEVESEFVFVFLEIGLFTAVVYVAAFLQTILHEAGHLLFGRMTGYRFSLFSIGSFTWIKVNGVIRFLKLKLTGAGGQCLMIPPDLQNGRFPYVLYNMGGSIINFLSSILFFGIALLFRNPVIALMFMILAMFGIAYALMNSIPIRYKELNNDGYNVMSIGKDPEALRSFWIQLKCSELSLKGIHIKDMPEEWFKIPSSEAMKNSMTAVLGVFACNRMMDQMEFEKAKKAIYELLVMNTGMIGLHRNLLKNDLIYCGLVNENPSEHHIKMLYDQQKAFMKSMKSSPSVQRTKYAYALLAEKDNIKALKIKEAFEKNYPYSSGERELMAYAERKCIASLSDH